jgi:hypothetical protein
MDGAPGAAQRDAGFLLATVWALAGLEGRCLHEADWEHLEGHLYGSVGERSFHPRCLIVTSVTYIKSNRPSTVNNQQLQSC